MLVWFLKFFQLLFKPTIVYAPCGVFDSFSQYEAFHPFDYSHTGFRAGVRRVAHRWAAFSLLVRPSAFDWLKNMRSAALRAL